MTRALLLFLALGCAPVLRGHAVDVAGQAAVGAVFYLDYSQTVDITRDGYEWNPIIGRRGDRVPPALYFAGAFMLHAVVAWALPRPYRNAWQAGWCVAEGVVVWNNWVDGYAP